jgi:hypothetical protein
VRGLVRKKKSTKMELITTDREDPFGRLPTRMRFQISLSESVCLSSAWLLTFPSSLSLIVCWWVYPASPSNSSDILTGVSFDSWPLPCTSACLSSGPDYVPSKPIINIGPLLRMLHLTVRMRGSGIERKICRRWSAGTCLQDPVSIGRARRGQKRNKRSAGCGQQAARR